MAKINPDGDAKSVENSRRKAKIGRRVVSDHVCSVNENSLACLYQIHVSVNGTLYG